MTSTDKGLLAVNDQYISAVKVAFRISYGIKSWLSQITDEKGLFVLVKFSHII